jgi:hypothetical protein
MVANRRSRLMAALALLLVVTACSAPGDPALVASTTRPTPDPTAGSAADTAEATPATTPVPTALPTPEPTAAPTPAAPFAMNLFRDGAFVQQYTFDWCVAASVQMAWNMVMPQARTLRDDQQALWEMARDRSWNAHGGANPFGWAAVLTEIGVGSYDVVSVDDYEQALRTAARAMRVTQRPVGLVMWSGRHAWVMSGFESLGDPALGDDFTVTGIRVVDPLYPYGSASWGPSPSPNSLLTPAQLATQFVVREPRRWSSGLGSGYLLVLPSMPLTAWRDVPARGLTAA